MIRTQVQFDEEQYAKLKALAATRSESISRVVRDAVARMLAEGERIENWRRLRSVVGTFRDEDAMTDVAAKHDEYLAEIYRK
jgi:hypothetical protein